MRFSTLAAMGVSAIALSGCSFLGNLVGYNGNNSGASHQQGSYSYDNDECCVGGKALSRWNVEGALGGSYLVGGDGITGSRTSIATSNVGNFDSNDIWDDGLRAELGGSYALNPNRKITGNLFYQKNESAGAFDMGDLNGDALRGSISDNESYGAELGLRQYFTPRVFSEKIRLRPYVEGKLGAAKLDDVTLDGATRAGAALPEGNSIALYDGGWVPTVAGMVGVETPIFKRATLGVETGLRWQGAPDAAGRDIVGGSPIAGINNGGDTWSVPLTVRGRYRF